MYRQKEAIAEAADPSGEIIVRERRRVRRPRRPLTRLRSAFTLIELLIVIALSGLLLALLFAPIVQGFRITNRTKAFVQAQDATRFGLENMEREIGEAAYVFDNTYTLINLPLEDSSTYPKRLQNGNPLYTGIPTAKGTVQFSYGRLDLIPVDLNTDSGNTNLDPTTGTPLGGGTTRVPGAPSSHRYIRYFVALRDPLKPYANEYLFARLGTGIDNDFNPFILYRVQYNPYDSTLITQNSNGTPMMGSASGAFGDPDFFYGGPHAAAWRAIASPVVSGPNLDMLVWQRQTNGQFDTGAPFRLATTFAPATVVGDTATPGFLSLENADAAGAVPTLYTAKNGQWTLPFTVNVFRGVSTGQAASTGTLSLHFSYQSVSGGMPTMVVTPTGTGCFASPTVYCFLSQSTGRFFVSVYVSGFLGSTTFWVDPARGRVETGIVPISGSNGAPTVYAYDSSTGKLNTTTPAALTSMTSGNNVIVQGGYELAPTIYRATTLDATNSGATITDATSGVPDYVPINQGILFADLRAQNATNTSVYSGYYLTTTLNTTLNNVPGSGKVANSPFVGFDGSILAPGTEHVVGPDNNLTVAPRYGTLQTELFNYFRAGGNHDSGSANTQPSKTTSGQMYNRSGSLSYGFDDNYKFTSDPILDFGILQMDYTLPTQTPASTYQTFLITNGLAGLPAEPAGSTSTTTSMAQSLAELQVSYLWQNNFARKLINGVPFPISADGNVAQDTNAGTVTPEPDVFRMDYATRSLLNISLGANVYDSTGGIPQSAQVSTKVKINNVGQ